MSHFAMGVIVEKSKIEDATNINDVIAEQIAAYDENINVEEYDQQCYCIGRQVIDLATKVVVEETGKTVEDFREETKDIKDRDEADKRWHELTGDYFRRIDELESQLMKNVIPKLDCEECNGTGFYKSTYNPLSKWDWWQIGGRWTGLLDGYKPSEDPDNIEDCYLCNATGLRNDNVGRNIREENPEYTCNGCQGTGKMLKWPSSWKRYEGDIASISVALEDLEKYGGFFGYVTPEKEWIEKGKMGWWAITTNEKDKDTWAEESKNILNKYNTDDYLIVVVDCHI